MERFVSMPPLPLYAEGVKAIPKESPWVTRSSKEVPADDVAAEAAGDSSEDTEDDQTLAHRVEAKSRLRSGVSSSAAKRPAPDLDSAIDPPPKQRRTAAKRVARKVLEPVTVDVQVSLYILTLLE